MMENFKDLIKSDNLVLIDFYATWCGPCRSMHPILEDLKNEKGDRIRIVKIDVDKHEALATELRIQSIPTLLLYRAGNLLWRQSGAIPLANLKTVIEKYE